jgi:hypothetical protein
MRDDGVDHGTDRARRRGGHPGSPALDVAHGVALEDRLHETLAAPKW